MMSASIEASSDAQSYKPNVRNSRTHATSLYLSCSHRELAKINNDLIDVDAQHQSEVATDCEFVHDIRALNAKEHIHEVYNTCRLL